MTLHLGIDEAGRGPIIGPMCFSGVLVDDKQEKILKMLGVKDSKLLTPQKREFLAIQIKKNVIASAVLIVSPKEIDKSLAEKVNLNQLEAKKVAEIINILSKKFDKANVVVDCPSTNITAWRAYLLGYIKNPEKIVLKCEHNADKNHVSVGAASILAKVTRDSEIEKIKEKIDIDLGSGYPSDPTTIEFLKKYSLKFKDSGIFRKSWQTWKDLHPTKEQKKLLDF